MNRRTRQAKYSYPFIKDVLRRSRNVLYTLVVNLVEKAIPTYDLVVYLARKPAYTLEVILQSIAPRMYDLQVLLQRVVGYDLEVLLQGRYIGPRNLEVYLREAIAPSYILEVRLVEGSEISGCIPLEC